MNITVFLGASFSNEKSFKTECKKLGNWIAEKGHTLIYGGSKRGLMGVLAEGAIEKGGDVIGIEPRFFVETVEQIDGLKELIVSEDMTDRKEKLISMGDAFIVFPGGTGTLEEVSILMSKQALGQVKAPCIYYNLNGYYDLLKVFLKQMVDMELSDNERQKDIYFASSLSEIEEILNRYFG